MLKKIIITASGIILCSIMVFSQDFQGGISGGLTASEVSGDHLAGKNKFGWYASAFTIRKISSLSDFKLEIMYIQKGSRSVPSERNAYYDYVFHLEYVEIPLLYQLDGVAFTDIIPADRIYLFSGFSLSVLTRYTESNEGFIASASPTRFHPAELNLLLGTKIKIAHNFFFLISISQGITPIRPHISGGTLWYNRGQYNTLWSFGLSYTLW
jgi:hypothetical protein